MTGGRAAIFCAPDVVRIRDRCGGLTGVDLYLGDGAAGTRSMVRKSDGALIAHTPPCTQMTWCEKEGVEEAIFTHCGSATVPADPEAVDTQVADLGEARGVHAEVAVDGLERTLH